MRILIFALFLIISESFAQTFQCASEAPVTWETIAPGLSFSEISATFSPYLKEEQKWSSKLSRKTKIRVLKIDLTQNKLLFQSTSKLLPCNPAKHKFIKLLMEESKQPVIAAINANFFEMPTGPIIGLALDEKKLWSADLSKQTISSSGVLAISTESMTLETKEDFITRFGSVFPESEKEKFQFAIQAYPKLLIDGQLQIGDGVKNVRHPRTSIGFNPDTREIFLTTIDADGEGENNTVGMTLFEYGHLLQNETCGVSQKTALNLDGGGSTAIAVPSKGLFEQADQCRHLGNILTVQARDK